MPKVYRVICYEGNEAWIEKQLDSSIHGTKPVGFDCSITVATIDLEDELSVEIARDKLFNTVATLTAREPYGILFETTQHSDNFGTIRLEMDTERLALYWGGRLRYKSPGLPII